jgi:hypothetical protein
LRIAPSESGASLSTYRWAENPGAGQGVKEIERLIKKLELDKEILADQEEDDEAAN